MPHDVVSTKEAGYKLLHRSGSSFQTSDSGKQCISAKSLERTRLRASKVTMTSRLNFSPKSADEKQRPRVNQYEIG